MKHVQARAPFRGSHTTLFVGVSCSFFDFYSAFVFRYWGDARLLREKISQGLGACKNTKRPTSLLFFPLSCSVAQSSFKLMIPLLQSPKIWDYWHVSQKYLFLWGNSKEIGFYVWWRMSKTEIQGSQEIIYLTVASKHFYTNSVNFKILYFKIGFPNLQHYFACKYRAGARPLGCCVLLIPYGAAVSSAASCWDQWPRSNWPLKRAKRTILSTGPSLRTRVLVGYPCGHHQATLLLGGGGG